MPRKAKFHLLLTSVVVSSQGVALSVDRSRWILCGVFFVAMVFCTSRIESLVYKLLKESPNVH